MKKTVVFVLLGVVLVALGALSMSVFGNSFKVTDPSNPLFKIENFRLANYTDEELPDVLIKVLPFYLERAAVDRILVDYGGARIVLDPKKNNLVYYQYTLGFGIDSSRTITVSYTAGNQVLTGVSLNGRFIFMGTN